MESPKVRGRLVRPVRVDHAGRGDGPTKAQAAGRHWRRTSRGFYVPSSVSSDDVDQRILEASVVLPDGGSVAGWAALRWQGGRWFDGTDATGGMRPVPLLIGTQDIRKQEGLLLCGEQPWPGYVGVVDGVPVTTPVWSVVHAMRYADGVRRAVLALDMAAYDDLVSLDEAAELIGLLTGWTGIPLARLALPLASENCWSPAECFMRLAWELDGGFPRPLPNQPVFDRFGRHLGTPDLLDPEAGVIGEYDGPVHLRREQRVRDVNRDARYRDHGLEVVTWTAGDPVAAFLRRLSAAYRRARGAGDWTITPPAWWTPTTTVASRRRLDDDQRGRLLRYRAA